MSNIGIGRQGLAMRMDCEFSMKEIEAIDTLIEKYNDMDLHDRIRFTQIWVLGLTMGVGALSPGPIKSE